MYLLVLLAITTGMKKSELMNLLWTDINFEKGLASFKDTKNEESRLNPIPVFVLDELRKHRQIGNGLIFFSQNNPEKPFDLRKQWYASLKRTRISNFKFHDLKHTAASYLVMEGANCTKQGRF